jgi:hypothetical protein
LYYRPSDIQLEYYKENDEKNINEL